MLERHRLKPGEAVVVESRDELAEMVRVRHVGDEPLELGFPAAGRVLVEPGPRDAS
jgi:hypothetical protein